MTISGKQLFLIFSYSLLVFSLLSFLVTVEQETPHVQINYA